MDAETALLVVRPLSEGIDPVTGEQYGPDSPYQNPSVVRALAVAVIALEYHHARNLRLKSQPAKAGLPWTSEEDDELLSAFDDGKTIHDLVKLHQRSLAAIRSRLEQFEKLQRG